MINSTKPVVVIGGRGRIGATVCRGLADFFPHVISVDLAGVSFPDENVDPADGVTQVDLDITNEVQVQEFSSYISEKFGVPSGLVVFAHYKGPTKLSPGADFFSGIENYPLVEWEKTLKVNLTGAFLSLREIGGKMVSSGSGSIVLVSSTYGLVGPDPEIYGDSGINSPVPYATTKAGLLGLGRWVASNWGPRGVRTNILVPGGVEDPAQSPNFKTHYTARTSLKRMASPDDYLGPIRFLLSPESNYMNGSCLVVDGGWTAM